MPNFIPAYPEPLTRQEMLGLQEAKEEKERQEKEKRRKKKKLYTQIYIWRKEVPKLQR